MAFKADENTALEIEGTARSGCSCLYFWRLLQVCNTLSLCALLGLAAYELTRIETLETELATEQATIAVLKEDVQEKQQDQIEELHQEVLEEHDLTFLTLAGIFTLLTCLISMFHMSSHLQKMNQPIIQRKIVAILWMSPIYSVTSFLSLLYPPLEGYMAIIKDFYESYCIYTFLSFLILVLGKGCRDNAAEVLAKNAHQLERPARCLSRWYDPPPDTSDLAKANAVITECQILAMQFVFIRPLTTVVWFVYSTIQSNKNPETSTATDSFDSAPVNVEEYNNNGTRWLQDEDWKDGVDYSNETTILSTLVPSAAPMLEALNTLVPTIATIANATGASSNESEEATMKEATKAYFTSFGFVLAMIINVSVFFAFTGLLKFYHAVHKDLNWCRPWPKFLTIKGVVFLTFWQGLAISIFINLSSTPNDSVDASAKAHRYQDILICLEMLFFSITHWCVFPAEEWETDYQPPQQVNKPGIGIQDFVNDVGHIVNNGRRRRKGRRRRNRESPRLGGGGGGLYHRPTASGESSTLPEEEDDDLEDLPHGMVIVDGQMLSESQLRARTFSDGSSVKADDEEDDLELL